MCVVLAEGARRASLRLEATRRRTRTRARGPASLRQRSVAQRRSAAPRTTMDKGSAGASSSSSNGEEQDLRRGDGRSVARAEINGGPFSRYEPRNAAAQKHSALWRSGALTAATKYSTAPKPAKTPEADPGTAATPRHACLPPGPARRVAPRDREPPAAPKTHFQPQATRAMDVRREQARPFAECRATSTGRDRDAAGAHAERAARRRKASLPVWATRAWDLQRARRRRSSTRRAPRRRCPASRRTRRPRPRRRPPRRRRAANDRSSPRSRAARLRPPPARVAAQREKAPLRKGKWTQEEELVHGGGPSEFERGMLACPAGTRRCAATSRRSCTATRCASRRSSPATRRSASNSSRPASRRRSSRRKPDE